MSKKAAKKSIKAPKAAAKKAKAPAVKASKGPPPKALLSAQDVKLHAPSHALFHWPWGGGGDGGNTGPLLHQVMASSFADPADISAFNKCKAQGGTDNFCFKFGDNGIGFMGANCAGPTPMCALPPEDWQARWGDKHSAHLKPVVVTANGRTVVCLLGDTMPSKGNITNGAGIDLSPAALEALGLEPPLMIPAVWSWQDDE